MIHMGRFIGREKEIHDLIDMINDPKIRSCAIIGRRRIGKTALIKELIKDMDAIYIQFIKSSSEVNLLKIASVMSDYHGKETYYKNPMEFFKDLSTITKKKRIVIVFDEYPYMSDKDGAFSSITQDFIDNYIHDSFLILSGSSVKMMESEVSDYSKPLYGRVRKYYVHEMPYDSMKEFHPNLDDVDSLRLYLTTGGIPYYLDDTPAESYKDYLTRYVLEDNSIFNTEGTNIINRELKNQDEIISILDAIAYGRNHIKEISDITGIERNRCSAHLAILESLNLVSKHNPMANAPRKPAIYYIKDNMLAFHFHILRMLTTKSKDPEKIYGNILPNILTLHGKMFEEFCKSLLIDNYDVKEIGKWWGTTVTKNEKGTSYESSEIDIVADINVGNNIVQLFVECKFRNEKCGLSTLLELEEHMRALNTNGRPMIISRSGFTNELLEYAEDHNILLIGMDEIVGRKGFPELS